MRHTKTECAPFAQENWESSICEKSGVILELGLFIDQRVWVRDFPSSVRWVYYIPFVEGELQSSVGVIGHGANYKY